jgi:hypothetical protein
VDAWRRHDLDNMKRCPTHIISHHL